MTNNLILVTGASGYIASRLIPRLLDRGYRVRALARRKGQLDGRAWSRYVDVVRGEVMDPSTLAPALQGVSTAYYLVHNMSSGRGYIPRELQGARNFAGAAEHAGLGHIIYLGGLADPHAPIAAHLRSRIQTGQVLREGRVPVTEFRAGVIAGPGSISFEMIRFMTELLPLVPGPAWLKNRSQPIAAQTMIDYLLAALENPNGRGRVFEIGGPEVIVYADLMREYARLRGLRRRLVMLPYIPLWFMALGVGLMTPVPVPIASALLDGLRSDSVVREPGVGVAFPEVKLIPYAEAVRSSLANLHPDRLEPVWRDKGRPLTIMKHEGFFIDHRALQVQAAPESVMRVVVSLGGKHGWLYADWLWKFRAWLDRFFSPRRREARDALVNSSRSSRLRGEILVPGEHLDFYRVEAREPQRLLLRSELQAPGQAWMEWRALPGERGGASLTQTSFFAPRGLPGFLYWVVLYPFHAFVFRGLIRAISRVAADASHVGRGE